MYSCRFQNKNISPGVHTLTSLSLSLSHTHTHTHTHTRTHACTRTCTCTHTHTHTHTHTPHRYLYYADGVEIYRIDTDGSNNMRIQWSGTVTGLAVDTTQNLLYWSHNGIVQSRNLSGDSVSNVDTVDSKPHGLSVRNGVLYWTHVGNISDNVPGAIYSLDTSDASSIPKRLHSSTVVHPLDISTSPTGGGKSCVLCSGASDKDTIQITSL